MRADLKRILIIILMMLAAIGVPQADETTAPEEDLIRLTAESYEFSLDMRSFIATGNVKLIRGPDVITADKISGDLLSGDILAEGSVHYEGSIETLDGDIFRYNFLTKNGIAQNAMAKYGPIIFTGKQIKSENGVLSIKRSTFTTCDKQKPHYHISAKEIIINPGNELVARNASINIMGKSIISIPRYKVDLSEDKASAELLPIIMYSEKSGISANYSFDLASDPKTDLALEIRYSTREDFQGGLHLDRLKGKPIFASVSYRERVLGGVDPEGMISKYPEIGVRYYSNPSMREKSVSRIPIDITRELIRPDSSLSAAKNLNFMGEFTAGCYKEEVDSVNTSGQRLDARMLAWYDPHIKNSKIGLYPAAFARISSYDSGDTYGVIGLKLAIGKKIGNDSYLSLGYITNATSGKSPFNFDTVELKNEAAAGLFFKLSDINVHINERFDISEGRNFSTDITLSKVYHCIEPSITWRSRSKEISFDLKLVGF